MTNTTSSSTSFVDNLVNMPLFMKDLPTNIENNDALMALQAIRAESSPLERAIVSKNNGNESYMQASLPSSITNNEDNYLRLKEAIGYYSSGIEILEGEKIVGEIATVKGILHLNRSAVYLSLKSYYSAHRDAKIARTLLPPLVFKRDSPNFDDNNSKSIKALHRQTKSALHLKLEDEVDILMKELRSIYHLVDPQPLFLQECEEDYSKYLLERKKKEEKEEKIMEKKNSLQKILHCHEPFLSHISFKDGLDKSLFDALNIFPQLEGMGMVRIGEDGIRVWPLLLMCPSTSVMDSIEGCSENCSIDDLLDFVQYKDKSCPIWNVYLSSHDHQTLWFGDSTNVFISSIVKNPSIISSVERGILHIILIPSNDLKAIKELRDKYLYHRAI